MGTLHLTRRNPSQTKKQSKKGQNKQSVLSRYYDLITKSYQIFIRRGKQMIISTPFVMFSAVMLCCNSF